jgi:methionyl-tRNA formyltransferase
MVDHDYLYKGFKQTIQNRTYEGYNFKFSYSYNNTAFRENYKDDNSFEPLDINKEAVRVIKDFDLIISLHCKQIFGKEIIKNKRCINIHPGYNPNNRGVFPQVFSIINKKPLGITIHEMDELLDHGPIIKQKQVFVSSWETSKDVYKRILEEELNLIDKYLIDIIEKRYITRDSTNEGNINYIKDFKKICKLDLEERLTMAEAIDKLRALTFEGYRNAYFIDENNNKVWVEIKLEKDDN